MEPSPITPRQGVATNFQSGQNYDQKPIVESVLLVSTVVDSRSGAQKPKLDTNSTTEKHLIISDFA